MDIVIRPRRGRLRTPVVTTLVIASVFLLCTGGAAVNHIGTDKPVRPAYLAAALALVLVPTLAQLGSVAMNRRNVFLRLAGDRLTLGEWTGRVVEVDQPRSVRSYPVGAGSLLVVTGRPEQAPIVLNPDWWAGEDLARLLATLGLAATRARATAVFPGTARDHAGSRLPFSVRHPAVFAVGAIATGMAWFFAMAFLVTHL